MMIDIIKYRLSLTKKTIEIRNWEMVPESD